ncbi:MAG: asparagine synthase (glutamine-hydrolyzing) [Melioribacteraceae bacterium]|nr:asparagine synthase (glutamine-hydrolyzing) [Melioribacteraceae bacterium]
MCGIIGYVSNTKYNDVKLLSTLSHRGPDDEGKYNYFENNKNVFLGHKRLSILDLSASGHQPMLSDDKNVIIVYNGEIYNFLDLRTKYLQEFKFNSNSDTEVIIKLYIKYGETFVHKLNGDFAIAIYDKRDNKLLLYRDRFGVKPLYFFKDTNTFFFASELKSFLAAELNKGITEEQLMNYFVFKYVPQNKTLFEDIYRITPGHYIRYNIYDDKAEHMCYWNPSFNTNKRINFNDAKNEVYSLLKDSVEKRLISDVPVGTFFSGGVDSSAIVYYMKDHEKIIHYSAKKNKNDLIEEGTSSDYFYASKLAKAWNLNLQQIDISTDEANIDLINLTNYYSDDLIADGSQIPSYLITKEAAKTSTVLLSGMGADEFFLGYGNHLLTLISNYFDKSPQFINDIILSTLKNVKQGRGYFKGYKRFLKKIGKYYSFPNYKYGLYSIVGDFENSYNVMNTPNQNAIKVFEEYFDNDNDPFTNMQKFELENFLVKNLHYLDRMCMANSVEGRVPFMDHRLVEFVISLPRNYKLSAMGKQKVVLKSAFEGKIPNDILYRRKAGFGMPLRSIFKKREKIAGLIDFDFLSSFHFFNTAHIKKLIDNHILGLEDNSAILYAIISFQSWYKTHLL